MLERNALNCLQPLHIRLDRQLEQAIDSPEHLEATIEAMDDKVKLCSDFVLALVTVVLRKLNQLDPSQEREALTPYKNLLHKYCAKKNGIWAIYAAQELWARMSCPQGVLLRWFIALYEEDIVEEEEFLYWKEDVNDNFAGKGKALFQVNQWLTWLQVEEEDDDAE